MLPVLLLVGGALIGAGIAIYWKNIAEWLKRIYVKLPPVIKQYLQGALSFAQRIGSTFKNVMKYYSYNEETKKWNETVVTTEVDESTIPAHIRNKLNQSSEVETTQDLEKELKLELS